MEKPINDFDEEIYQQLSLPGLNNEEASDSKNESIDRQNLWEDEQIFI